MANKSKDKPVEPMMVEEAVEEKVEDANEIKADHEDFLERKLKAINNMSKPAKAERLANRLLRKARN